MKIRNLIDFIKTMTNQENKDYIFNLSRLYLLLENQTYSLSITWRTFYSERLGISRHSIKHMHNQERTWGMATGYYQKREVMMIGMFLLSFVFERSEFLIVFTKVLF